MVDGTVVVTLSGELDAHVAPDLRDHLARLREGGTDEVVLDLSELHFIDSMGLGSLIAAANGFRAVDGHLRLRALTPRVARVLELTGMDSYFEIAA